MILVAGPPCGGKSTYVRQNAASTASVLDFDDIVERLTGERYSREQSAIDAARLEWRQRVALSDWVIWSAPRRAQRGRFSGQYRAAVVVVMASMDECLRRAADTRPDSWQRLIGDWFAAWEPSRSGREQIVDTSPSPALGFFAT